MSERAKPRAPKNEQAPGPSRRLTRSKRSQNDSSESNEDHHDSSSESEERYAELFRPEVKQVPIISPRLWERFMPLIVLLYCFLKYNIINYLFVNGHVLAGALFICASSIIAGYQLITSIRQPWQKNIKAISLLVLWIVFIFWQVRKYRHLYEILQYQRYFRLFLWESTGELVDPNLSTLLVIHMEAGIDLLALHIVRGMETIHSNGDEERLLNNESGKSRFYPVRYAFAIYYFVLTLPLDFERPRTGEHALIFSLYSLNNIVVPCLVFVVLWRLFHGGQWTSRFQYWFFFALLMSHSVYEIVTFTATLRSFYYQY